MAGSRERRRKARAEQARKRIVLANLYAPEPVVDTSVSDKLAIIRGGQVSFEGKAVAARPLLAGLDDLAHKVFVPKADIPLATSPQSLSRSGKKFRDPLHQGRTKGDTLKVKVIEGKNENGLKRRLVYTEVTEKGTQERTGAKLGRLTFDAKRDRSKGVMPPAYGDGKVTLPKELKVGDIVDLSSTVTPKVYPTAPRVKPFGKVK